MTPRYKLRTLLILLAILPPLLWLGWTKYEAWRAKQERLKALREAQQQQQFNVTLRISVQQPAQQPIAPTVGPPGALTETRPMPDRGPQQPRE
jgi:hypothetical protein